MTDIQEAILDRLVVVKMIGSSWGKGPLGIALETLKARKLHTRGDVSQALGYPMLLCQALQSANTHLKEVEERRKLAITFFTEVVPRARVPRLAPRLHIKLALWCARRVHPLICRQDCPWATHITEVVARELGELKGEITPTAKVPPCPAVVNGRQSSEGEFGTAADFAEEALIYARRAACYPESARYQSIKAARVAARVAVRVKGLAGGIDFSLALAREVGLKP